MIANQFNNRLAELQDALSGVSREVGSVFLPVFTEAFRASSDEVARLRKEVDLDDAALRKMTASGIANLLDGLAALIEVGEGVVTFFKSWGRALDRVGSALKFVGEQAARMLGGTTVNLIETGLAAKGLSDSFDGVGEAATTADTLAASARRLAGELRGLGEVRPPEGYGVLAEGIESAAAAYGVLLPAEEAASRSAIGAAEAKGQAVKRAAEEAARSSREIAALTAGEAAVFRDKEAAKVEEARRSAREIAALTAGDAEAFRGKEAAKVEEARRSAREIAALTVVEAEAFHAREQATRKATEDAAASAQSLQSVFKSAYGAIESVATNAFSNIGKVVDGQTKTMGKAMAQFFGGLSKLVFKAVTDFLIAKAIEVAAERSAAGAKIAAAAASGAAKAGESQAGIPIAGPILAAIAAAAMFITLSAYAGKFHDGGMVRGPSGRDNLVAFVEDGEYILPRHVVQDIQGGRRPGTLGSFATGGAVTRETAANVSGGGVTLQVNLHRTIRGDRADLRREVHDTILPELQRLIQSGALDVYA